MRAHVAQHVSGELGAVGLQVEADQLVGEVQGVHGQQRAPRDAPVALAQRHRQQLQLELLELLGGQVLQRIQDGVARAPHGSRIPGRCRRSPRCSRRPGGSRLRGGTWTPRLPPTLVSRLPAPVRCPPAKGASLLHPWSPPTQASGLGPQAVGGRQDRALQLACEVGPGRGPQRGSWVAPACLWACTSGYRPETWAGSHWVYWST
uniref:Putative uncharacterized protein PYCARD-AS1 n=1 Tax=Homo sapiens TaxID=9606 RepID=PYAS1_HUMAN|nr:RecName: Full=Putative uncharacterized protein PYCARD-AS1; AltName: Full=PYCARD antisense RNA 1; AltName: Full=PYCARD antisense gene protein 1; AltName: Full=PYCARD opposite strand protein [Homo sapiens]